MHCICRPQNSFFKILHYCLASKWGSAVQELENYILDLRRQLAEAAEERSTLLTMQRQTRAEVSRMNSQVGASSKCSIGTQCEVCSFHCKSVHALQVQHSAESVASTKRELAMTKSKLKVQIRAAASLTAQCLPLPRLSTIFSYFCSFTSNTRKFAPQ